MSPPKFPSLPSGYPFPRLEEEVLAEWKARGVFEKTLAQTAGKTPFVFYEGPPTANNKPHVGHVLTRVVKDVFPRFKTMRGFHVARKAGWDTHGLPVEIEVEKKLGFSGKQDIERYGVEKFNRSSLESVHTYVGQWREMTERIGYWVDLDAAYFTYTNRYVESVWWALAELFRQGLLEKGYKIQPYCARCGTTLSSHEVAQNYKETDDPSVWVRFPARPGQKLATIDGQPWQVPEGLAILAWTTTPWTLLGHSGLAVHPELVYRVIEEPGRPGGTLLFADALETAVPYDAEVEGKRRRIDLRDLPVVARIAGRELAKLRYDRPFEVTEQMTSSDVSFDPPPGDEHGWCVFAADYVTATEGTGIVHTAPAFGEDDYASGRKHGLPFMLTIDAEGRVTGEGTEPFAGLQFKEADRAIIRDLKGRGLLLHSDRYRHNYPFCWRCDQPLLYYASRSWFVTTTKRKGAIIAKNRDDIRWLPEHVGQGRFGNWLENMVDWALSRKRYWGTPLPIWECDRCPATRAIGGYAELFAAAGKEPPADVYDREQFDPHRPFVDRDAAAGFTWPCPDCEEGTMGRVDDVIDAWFDSGAMPFAQHHYTGKPVEGFDAATGSGFPADFISEAVDQTRGWFYTLHVLGILLFDQVAYRNCIVCGHINDEDGRKMSKRIGNVVDPMEVIAETGADAMRWYFCVSNPLQNSRFSARLVREAAQKFLLPLWNALSFFTIYANIDGWRPRRPAPDFAQRPALDRWILLRLDRTVTEVTDELDRYELVAAARALEGLIDDLTNWYIRRSRDRFWATADETDKESAYQALHEVLVTLARLIAPFTPFIAEVLHRNLVRSQDAAAAESVHLESWPAVSGDRHDEPLAQGIAAVQRIVRLGHAARNEHSLKIRQPLAAVTVVTTDGDLRQAVEPFVDLLREELNVHRVDWARDRSRFVHHEVRPVFPRCGPRFGKQMKALQAALAAADGDRLAAELEREGRIEIEVDGEPVALDATEVEVRLIERPETATQGDRDLLVALDGHLSDELIAEGRAREIIHRIQSARKELDLDYADRIRVTFHGEAPLDEVVAGHEDWIAGETLALKLTPAGSGDGLDQGPPLDGLAFALKVERA